MEEFLKEAIDSTFLNDSMYKNFGKESPKEDDLSSRKSERFLPDPTEVDKELPVTDSMKKFMSKKLSDLVAKQTCFVETPPGKISDTSDAGIRLFKDSHEYIKEDNSVKEDEVVQVPQRRWNKRKLPDDVPEKEKIQQASISPEIIFSQKDTKHWSAKRKSRTCHYREKNKKLYLQEPENEFTQLRKKNNWDESKISKYKRNC